MSHFDEEEKSDFIESIKNNEKKMKEKIQIKVIEQAKGTELFSKEEKEEVEKRLLKKMKEQYKVKNYHIFFLFRQNQIPAPEAAKTATEPIIIPIIKPLFVVPRKVTTTSSCAQVEGFV